MEINNHGGLSAPLPEQFQYSVFYKLGAIESQLTSLNAVLSKHVIQTANETEKTEKRLGSLEEWRTQVNARAGALGAFVGTIASILVVIADKYLLPILGKFASGV